MEVIQRIADQGNTVIMIEHNLDVILQADHIIDLGPEGGGKGGDVVITGTPEKAASHAKSYTGKYLKEIIDRRTLPGRKKKILSPKNGVPRRKK